MITGSHAIIYAEDPEAARSFLRDFLELPFVDVNGGGLIFNFPSPSWRSSVSTAWPTQHRGAFRTSRALPDVR
jgi:hypothetical protein